MATYYILTGAAGFIGSNLLRALNQRGVANIIAVDNLERAEKFHNLVGCEFEDFIDKRDFLERLQAGEFDDAVEAVLHQGACSNTMESNGRYMMDNNYRYSLALLDFCVSEDIPLIYASSAAVYGGNATFIEARENESPLNVYGYSKYAFDLTVRRRIPELAVPVVGLRYFNVYGPREAHKGRMASVAWHFFNQYQAQGTVRLFAGSGGYGDGEQRRDFVSVDDIVRINLHFLEQPEISGIFNAGTGVASTFNEVAVATVNACRTAKGEAALGLDELRSRGVIQYIPIPPELAPKYQHFTQADTTRLRAVGFGEPFTPIAEGVAGYVKQLLQEQAR